ncbi:MAG: DUF541 domain-containing protein [Alphaproteobacteria bacterium]|jgi:uncharacterized protein YggE|nr:DUF541 domain-containing protein [Alphaproteobacteria bacterium]
MIRLARLSLLALCLTLTALAAQAQTAPETLRTLTVNGRGEIEVAPDMATVRLAVRAEAETTGEALDEASAATQAILAMLDEEGVEPGDIQTGALRLNPIYAQQLISGQRQITGYAALNSISVTVNDLDRLGGLITAAVNEGANTLSGVSFGLKDPQAHEDAARRAAVADARRRAALYAEAGGVALGQMISLNEQGTGGYSPVRAEPMAMEASLSRAQADVPVAAGEITLSASIVVIYAMGDAG